jgi:DNA-directed RNA polymerase subunit alpha
MAVVEAGKILRKHLNPFVQYFELGDQLAAEAAVQRLQQSGAQPAAAAAVDPDLEQKLDMTVQELDLSVRANNCLESARINTVRELVQKTDQELLKVRSFGKTSLREVKRRLADMGLSLGMDLEAIRSGQSGAMESYSMPEEEEVSAGEEA